MSKKWGERIAYMTPWFPMAILLILAGLHLWILLIIVLVIELIALIWFIDRTS